jgi:glycosyltransferase involved in cell wall biosynthesis
LINLTIPEADLCLGGPFGNTEQARRVITGKTSQCLALGKPTIIGKIDEDIGFVDKQNCLLVPQGNPQALAQAIQWAFDKRHQLSKIGEQGRSIYSERLSVNVIRQLLSQALSDLKSK